MTPLKTEISNGKTTPFHGTLNENVTWQGEIWLDADVIVPAGSTLTLLPGTAVHFLNKEQPDFQVRRASGIFSKLLATSAGRPYILVEGSLDCIGKPEAGI